ncbi:hypothetical protein OTU49_017055 [Cherax quadricarinatus]|uniref:Uncharacterized protein n=1 Tax=Cherax quadricarinatus TaxID=27406 RepID=A0AAW0XQ60_CHEQU
MLRVGSSKDKNKHCIREMILFIEQNLHLDKKLNEDCECGDIIECGGPSLVLAASLGLGASSPCSYMDAGDSEAPPNHHTSPSSVGWLAPPKGKVLKCRQKACLGVTKTDAI